mmetsp:Transcript_1422/g.2682  ORF Transcript_1422/g.2682 Transcript_1422/m.2682 type:complete len:119 (-) Transcript_1422:130-486(-)
MLCATLSCYPPFPFNCPLSAALGPFLSPVIPPFFLAFTTGPRGVCLTNICRRCDLCCAIPRSRLCVFVTVTLSQLVSAACTAAPTPPPLFPPSNTGTIPTTWAVLVLYNAAVRSLASS